MKKELSKLFSLNQYDVYKALILFFVTTLLDLVYQAAMLYIENKASIDWKQLIITAGVATLGYLLKNFMTGTQTEPQPFKPEK